MFLLIKKDTTIFRCKCHFPKPTMLYIKGLLRIGIAAAGQSSGKGWGVGRPLPSPQLSGAGMVGPLLLQPVI